MPNPGMITLKIDFTDLAREAKSVGGFSPCLQFLVGPNDVSDWKS